MVTKTFICANGHQWTDERDTSRCPICGAEVAETIGNGNADHGSTAVGARDQGAQKWSGGGVSRFGRYQIVEELGRGGMGIVYRAIDPVQQRHVALKTLPHADPLLLSRFKREFRALAGLDHPHVVKLFELTSDGETWFFTMEMIEGVDLLNHVGLRSPHATHHEALEDDDPDVTQVYQLFELSADRLERIRDGFAQLAGAIAALHANGIVHRDIKPSNVMVTPAGKVVLLDFGLVAMTDASGAHQSLHHQVTGTAAYMSPEQAACEPVSSAADWYSVGVMLYQALTGRLPFTGKALDILVNKQKQDPVPPREIEPAVSDEWNDLCVALLQRDPKQRPAAEAILEILGTST